MTYVKKTELIPSITKARSKVVFFITYIELSGGNSPKKTPGAKPKEARTLAVFKSFVTSL